MPCRVFTLEDALSLVARRADLVQAQPGGAMLAVRLPEKDVLPLLNGHLSLAAINSPNLCVLAGPHEAVSSLEQFEPQGVTTRRLHTSARVPSRMMDPVLGAFTEVLSKVKLNEPTIPYVSNVTARWITAQEATSPAYWAGHVRQTVRFAEGIERLRQGSRRMLSSAGSRTWPDLSTTLARQHPAKSAGQTVLASLALTGALEPRGVIGIFGRLWMAGVAVDWQAFYADERRRKVVLPEPALRSNVPTGVRQEEEPDSVVKDLPAAASEIPLAAAKVVRAPALRKCTST